MNIKAILLFSSIVLVAYGLGFMVIPSIMLGLYGVSLDLPGIVITQLLGAAFCGLGILNWRAQNITNSAFNKIIILSNAVHFFLGFILLVIGKLNGAGNNLVWFNPGLYLLFSAGFLFYFIEKKSEK